MQYRLRAAINGVRNPPGHSLYSLCPDGSAPDRRALLLGSYVARAVLQKDTNVAPPLTVGRSGWRPAGRGRGRASGEFLGPGAVLRRGAVAPLLPRTAFRRGKPLSRGLRVDDLTGGGLLPG
jgi:hypothetical protein